MAGTGQSKTASGSAGSFKGAVVVSGASRGVGRSAAETLAARGYRVYAGVLSAAEARAWKDETVQQGRVVPLALDITRDADIAALAARLHDEPQPLRALVNVAGISQFDAVEHIDAKIIRRLFDVNVFGTLALTQALLPHLKLSHGRVVFVTSMAAKASAPLLGAYSSTKAAMESLIDSLRVEIKPFGVSVTTLEPGGIRTVMVDEAATHLQTAIARSRAQGPGGHSYVAAYQSIADAIATGVNKYLSPETVAAMLADLVEAETVRARYVLGLDAKAIVGLRRLLPDRVFDAIMARQFKLS